MVDNAISSWKVAGEGDNTTVVLRLKPVSTPATTTNMADPVLNRTTQIQYYRRKPPSQIRRDKERVRQQQQRQASEQENRHYAVDAVSFNDTESEKSATQDTEATTATHVDQLANEEEPVGADVLHALDNLDYTWTSDDKCVPSLQYSGEVDIEENIDRSVGDFNTRVVKSYVATLTDKSVQRRLKDGDRNKSLRKVVLHHSDDSDLLICESDDLVLEYSCSPDTASQHCVYWYVKQEDRAMLTEERAKLANLRRGERTSRRRHADIQARAARELDTLRDLIRFYLG